MNPWPRTAPFLKDYFGLTLLHISYLEHKTNDWVQSKINFLVGPQKPLLATVKRRKLAWFRHVSASPKPLFRAPWRVGDAVVGRGSAGWTTSKSGHSCPCQSCSQGPYAKKTGRGSLLNSPSCPADDPVGQGTELNWYLGWFLSWSEKNSPSEHLLCPTGRRDRNENLRSKIMF